MSTELELKSLIKKNACNEFLIREIRVVQEGPEGEVLIPIPKTLIIKIRNPTEENGEILTIFDNPNPISLFHSKIPVPRSPIPFLVNK